MTEQRTEYATGGVMSDSGVRLGSDRTCFVPIRQIENGLHALKVLVSLEPSREQAVLIQRVAADISRAVLRCMGPAERARARALSTAAALDLAPTVRLQEPERPPRP